MNRNPSRRNDLDWLRVLAVLLLIPFHSARVFDVFEPFYVKNAQTSGSLSWGVVAFLDTWHMPLLFVLAGAATWLALGHRTGAAYAKERLGRLLVPLVFGLVVIVPPQAYLARLVHGRETSPVAFASDYWTFRGNLTGYTGNWTPAHLWFIGFLFVFSLAALPLFLRWRGREIRVRWLLYAMPLLLLVANELPAPDDGPQNPWYSFALFVAGFLLLADPRAERAVHVAWRGLSIAAIATMTTLLLVWSSGIADRWADLSPGDIALATLEQVNTWIWVLALLGAAKALLGSGGRILRYASEASYPVYLLHQTVIVAVAYVVVGWDLGVWPKFALVGITSLGLTLAAYEIAVRRRNGARWLFGMRPRPVLAQPKPELAVAASAPGPG